MKPLEHIQHCYFIGIGGIGMSALARYMHTIGKLVSGYDKTPSNLTDELQKEGIKVYFEDEPLSIQHLLDTATSLIVYTPAIPEDNKMFAYFKQKGYTLVKRAELLGVITKSTQCLAVAGTHGKTTTTAILGHLLAFSNQEVTAFLGGISENYKSNFIQKGNKITVVEADEFDRSFLQLSPFIAGITSMDADHLDIYGDSSSIEKAFEEFANLVPQNGFLLHKKGLPLKGKTVAVEEPADFEANHVRISNGNYVFDFKTPSITLYDLVCKMPGRHNLFNTALALAMALCLGISTHTLQAALLDFKGVQRRFTYKIKTNNFVLIDDYAHHPQEIEAVFLAIREMYPNKEVLVVFQPHLYSRTRDFGEEFSKQLAKFDSILLLDIYPAREKPLNGITSKSLLDKIPHQQKKLIEKQEIFTEIKQQNKPINVFLGAGDIGVEAQKITNLLEHES